VGFKFWSGGSRFLRVLFFFNNVDSWSSGFLYADQYIVLCFVSSASGLRFWVRGVLSFSRGSCATPCPVFEM